MKTNNYYAFYSLCWWRVPGQRHQQQVSSESIIEEAVRKGEVLKGEIVPIDTALFRYAYRMRVQGDKAVILDLHNADYYYHVFTYPDFQYQSSFGKAWGRSG